MSIQWRTFSKRWVAVCLSLLCIPLCISLVTLHSNKARNKASIESFKELQIRAETRRYDYWNAVLVLDNVSEIQSPSAVSSNTVSRFLKNS